MSSYVDVVVVVVEAVKPRCCTSFFVVNYDAVERKLNAAAAAVLALPQPCWCFCFPLSLSLSLSPREKDTHHLKGNNSNKA